MPELLLVAFIILIALIFDFINGFHDSANSIATVVATNVLPPRTAVLLAAFWNFFGVFIFSVAVAKMVGSGIIKPESVTLPLILSAVIGAIAWNLITWYHGIPSSSSHALIGGLVGASFFSSGLEFILFSGVTKVLIFIFIAPVLGMLGAFLFSIFLMWLFRASHPHKINFYFRKLQLISSSFYSLSHGTNDAQKTMGIIALVLFSAGMIETFYVPLWVIIASYSAIALGTYFGGWRIVKTMGTRIVKLKPFHGFAAETSGASVIFGSSLLGIPVSTTHVIGGSIIGVGSAQRISAVRWQVTRTMVVAWLITIPMAGLIAGLCYLLLSFF